MGNVLEEMGNQVPYSFFRFDILLAANMAVLSLQLRIAIEAILFLPFLKVAQADLILLKIVKFKVFCTRGALNVRKDRVILMLKKQV